MRRISGTSHRVGTEGTPLSHMAEGVLSFRCRGGGAAELVGGYESPVAPQQSNSP